ATITPPPAGRRRRYLVRGESGIECDAGAFGTPHCCCEHAEQNRLQGAPPVDGHVSWRRPTMERQVERCCGLDVHKDTVAACVRIGGGSRPRALPPLPSFRRHRGELVVARL